MAKVATTAGTATLVSFSTTDMGLLKEGDHEPEMEQPADQRQDQDQQTSTHHRRRTFSRRNRTYAAALVVILCFVPSTERISDAFSFPSSVARVGRVSRHGQRSRYRSSHSSSSRDGDLIQDSCQERTAPSTIGKDTEAEAIASRRNFVAGMVSSTMSVGALSFPSIAAASQPEIDDSGEMFSPKSVMLRGGNDKTRGIALQKGRSSSGSVLKPGQALQTVYEPRFIAYLSRFLLNFDPAARSWWAKQGLDDTWDTSQGIADKTEQERYREQELRFAQFAESVEFGLADYFVGPYGSYASVQAAKAGLSASRGQLSSRDKPLNIIEKIFARATKSNPKRSSSNTSLAKEGVFNLYALLKARYVSEAAKRQLAILFSLISSPDLQPVQEITSLLGEADNATVVSIDIQNLSRVPSEETSRTSSRRGGGYSLDDPPKVSVGEPPALGGLYRRAKAEPVMVPTSRLLRIDLVDGGAGYTRPPVIIVTQGDVERVAKACTILNRNGEVESIVLLDPGYGYGGFGKYSRNGSVPPSVSVEAPLPRDSRKEKKRKSTRRAKAVAVLEYEVVGVKVTNGGNGYSGSNLPTVSIAPPENDPDWYLPQRTSNKYTVQTDIDDFFSPLQASVTSFQLRGGNTVTDNQQWRVLDYGTLERVRREPLELLPSSIRPRLVAANSSNGDSVQIYRIQSLPVTLPINVPSATFRAFDPVFGGVGSTPVTKGALALSASEYTRLALSGAICTVMVRNALNPLELIKTKLQLKNDKELLDFVSKPPIADSQPSQMNSTTVRTATTTKQSKADSSQHRSGTNSQAPTRQEEPPPAAAAAAGGGGQSRTSPSSQSGTKPESLKEGRLSNPAMTTATLVESKSKTISTRHQATAPSTATDTSPPLTDDNTADMDINNDTEEGSYGTLDLLSGLFQLRGIEALFQSADITFLTSLVYGSLGFGATELFRRSFTLAFFADNGTAQGGGGEEVVLLAAAAMACVVTAAAASPFEVLRIKSMGTIEPMGAGAVLESYLTENGKKNDKVSPSNVDTGTMALTTTAAGRNDQSGYRLQDYLPLWGGFAPILSRELPFAIIKFLTFDVLAKAITTFANNNLVDEGALPIQVGVGTEGLAISAVSGAFAGVAAAIVSHPADLILTLTSSGDRKGNQENRNVENDNAEEINNDENANDQEDWRDILLDLLSQKGGVANVFVGLPARCLFFFLVIGLQFFLYDYVKGIFQVGSDDLSLVLDVFYAVRQGLSEVVYD